MTPKQSLYIKLLLAGGPNLPQIAAHDMFRDLGFMALWIAPEKDRIYEQARPYKEVCAGCMTYTGQTQSLDVMDTCPNCRETGKLGTRYHIVAHSLGLETYGIDRRILSQLIYQAIEGDDLDAYR